MLFRAVLTNVACSEHDIKEYTHLPPHAALELGLVYRKLEDFDEARHWLQKAIYEYSNYMNATTVHIRAHTALMIMRAATESENLEDKYASIEDRLRQMQQNKSEVVANCLENANPPEEVLKSITELEVEDLS